MYNTALLVAFLAGGALAQPNKPRPCGCPGCPSCTVVPNLWELDCKTAQLAFEFGTAKVKSSPQALHDALNLWNCSKHLTPEQLAANSATLAGDTTTTTLQQPAAGSIYVSPVGNDAAPGTKSEPLRTLGAAATSAAKAGAGGSVVIRAGKYFLNQTLELTKAHSGTSWSAFPGETVIISGGRNVAGMGGPVEVCGGYALGGAGGSWR